MLPDPEICYEASETWLGDIPESWSALRIGDLFELRSTKVSDEDYRPLSVTKKGIVPQLDSVAKSDNHANRKLVKEGDFAINSRSDRRNSCGFSPYDGSVSTITTVLFPRQPIVSRYFDLLFDTPRFAEEFYRWGHGIDSDIWTTNWSDMKKIVIPCPPISEQKRIVDYLSDELKQIRSARASVQAEIENISFDVVTERLCAIDDAVSDMTDGNKQNVLAELKLGRLSESLESLNKLQETFVYEIVTGKRRAM